MDAPAGGMGLATHIYSRGLSHHKPLKILMPNTINKNKINSPWPARRSVVARPAGNVGRQPQIQERVAYGMAFSPPGCPSNLSSKLPNANFFASKPPCMYRTVQWTWLRQDQPELELELIHTHLAQKPMLRVEPAHPKPTIPRKWTFIIKN